MQADVLEWLRVQRESFASDIGLAGNDVSAFYPLIAFFLAMLYFVTQRRKLVGDYFQSEEEYENSQSIRAVAQLGLKFFTTVADQMGVYNMTTPTERKDREQEFIDFIKRAHQQSNMKKLGALMETEIVSQAAKSGSTHLQNAETQNTECEQNFSQTSWWKAKYTFTSICDREEPNVVRYLPMSFFLEGTDSSGARVFIYGPIKSLVVECDADVTGPVPRDNVAWKMHFELVDTNWRQAGGNPAVNHVFKFVCSQQNDQCVFSTLVGSDGKAFNVFVSRFVARLEEKPVSVSDNVWRRFKEPFNSDDNVFAHAELTIHPGRDLMVSYVVRALKEIDSTIVWKKQSGNMLLVGGITSDTKLPLEIHIRSPDALDDDGNKYLAYPVYRVMIRYHTTPPVPGELQPDSAAIKSIQFLLPDDRVLAQDSKDRLTWVVNNVALHRDATIDLVVLNKTPVASNARNPSMSGGVRSPATDGVVWFTDFSGIRQGLSRVSVSEQEQNKVRATVAPSQPWDDIRVNRRADLPSIAEVFGDRRSNAVVIGIVVALMLGWRVGNRQSITTLGNLSSYVGMGTAIFAFISAVLEHWDYLPAELRPYEPVLYVIVCTSLIVNMAVTLYASRFVPETSATLMLAMALAVLASIMMLSFETRSPAPLSPNALGFKISMLLVVAASMTLCSMEIHKLSRKTADDVAFAYQPLEASLGNMPNPSSLISFATIILFVAGLASIEWTDPGDQCDRLIYERNRANQNVADNTNMNDPKQRAAYNYFRTERQIKDTQAKACIAEQPFPFHRINMFTAPGWSDYVPILIVMVPMYVSMISPVIGKYISLKWPSRLNEEKDPAIPVRNRIEDGRTPRRIWMLKTLVGLLLIYSVISLLAPYTEASPGYCTHLRKMEKENFDVVQSRPIDMDAKQRMDLVYDGEYRYDCIPRRTMATALVVGGVAATALLSWVAPARKRYVPVRTSAMQTLGSLVYFISLASVLVWGYGTMNRVKVLNF